MQPAEGDGGCGGAQEPRWAAHVPRLRACLHSNSYLDREGLDSAPKPHRCRLPECGSEGPEGRRRNRRELNY